MGLLSFAPAPQQSYYAAAPIQHQNGFVAPPAQQEAQINDESSLPALSYDFEGPQGSEGSDPGTPQLHAVVEWLAQENISEKDSEEWVFHPDWTWEKEIAK